jgi:hypothetical protein
MVSDGECRRILDVARDASPEEIRQAYLDLARVWHPDRFQSDERLRQIAQDHFCEVNEAYAVLRRRGQPEPASCGGATVTDDPPPVRPDPGRPPKWTSSRTQWPAFRRPSSLALSRFVSNKVAYTTMVTVMVALPFVAVYQLASLLRVPSLDRNSIASEAFQPKILSPMRIIDPHSDVLGAADALTNWARGDAIDLWKPVRQSVPDSPATTAGDVGDGRKPPGAAPRNRKPPVDTTALQPAPQNGADLIPVGRQSGAGEFRLSNHTGLEAVFQLVSEHRTRRAVYVVPDGSVTLRSIPIGVYYLYVDLGNDLDVEHLRFQRDRMTPAPLGPFQFLQVVSETGTAGNHYDVILKPQ